MKIIWLTKGQFALVDDSDYDFLNQWKWHVLKAEHTSYAVRSENGKRIWMHRVILGLTDVKIFSDHEDRIGLNNQRKNLRIATQSENEANKVSHKDSVHSNYKGVTWDKFCKKWVSRICKDRVNKHLGRFDNETDAANAYNVAAQMYHGGFARLNNISV